MKTQKLLAAGLLSAVCLLAHAEFVVVVSAKSPVNALTSEQASQIFLGKVATFPGGEAATPVDQPDGAPIRNEFYEKLTSKTQKQILAYRANMVFSGKGKPPKELPSSQDVKKAVSESPNVIGYIEKSAVDSSVRIILTQP